MAKSIWAPMKSLVALQLRKGLLLANMSREEFRKALEEEEGMSVSKQAISFWCAGENCPRTETFHAIARVLGRRDARITVAWLLAEFDEIRRFSRPEGEA